MLRLPKQNYPDMERIIEFDFVRATEAAALNSLRWLGRGDKEQADAGCEIIEEVLVGAGVGVGAV